MKSMIFVLLLLSHQGVASVDEHLYNEWTLAAKNEREWFESKARHNRYTQFKKSCEIELARKWIPAHCFLPLKEEKESQALSEVMYQQQRAFLTHRCLQAEFAKHDIVDLQKKAHLPEIPSICRKAILKAHQVGLYQSQESQPEKIFKSRF